MDVSKIAYDDTKTNRIDTWEGKLASMIERNLFMRLMKHRIEGYTIEASQEITANIINYIKANGIPK